MATYIPHNRPVQTNLPTPLTLTALQTYVGGFISFIDLPSGDVLVINEAASELAPPNASASSLAHRDVFGDVVLCDPSEIA